MKIEQFQNEIFLNVSGVKGPKTLNFAGRRLTRFLDIFYLPHSPEDLSRQQVLTINKLRAKHIGREIEDSSNYVVKDSMRTIIKSLNVHNLLEIGPGESPLFDSTHEFNSYVLAEIDDDCIRQLELDNYDARHFSSNLERLGPFDLLFAVFVFHFPITQEDIDTMCGCLSSNGLILTNMYNRTESSRIKLAQAFTTRELEVIRFDDPLQAAKNHEYWVIQKRGIEAGKVVRRTLERLTRN